MKFTLRQLEVFLATARLEHLSNAALQLAMSQSAASDALKELEHQFNLKLFDRVGKRLQLNEVGRLMLPKAEELLSRANELEQLFLQQPAQEGGSLRVGATLSIGNHLCVPLIERYRRLYPQSQFNLEIGNTEQISAKVASFELDVGLIEGEINQPMLDISTWRSDDLVIFASPQHPLARQTSLSKQDLRNSLWILRENGSGTRQTFNRVLHDLLPELQVILEVQQTEAIIQAVKAGMGLGCLSLLSLADPLARGEVVKLAVKGRQFQRRLYLIVHKQKYRTSALQHWLDLCQASSDEALP
jgi:DNA-binding transcriptional LysR family regulator